MTRAHHLITPGSTGDPTLYPPHQPCPPEAQCDSHKTQDETVEYVWTAKGLAQAIPENGQREEAWRQADHRPNREVPELDPGRPQDHVDDVKGATGRRRMATTVRTPRRASPRLSRVRRGVASRWSPSRPMARPMRKATTALTNGPRERGEEAGCWSKNEGCLEDEEGERDHEQAAEGDTSTHHERRERPGCDGIGPVGEAGRRDPLVEWRPAPQAPKHGEQTRAQCQAAPQAGGSAARPQSGAPW